MDNKMPRIGTLGYIGFYINSAIANGYINEITFDEIYKELESNNLLEYLNKKIPNQFDFSLFPPNSEQCIAFHNVINEIAGGLEGRERRKVGIEDKHHGLSLLMAFIIEALQQQSWI